MRTELDPLLDFGLQESVDLINQGFSGYAVPIELSLPVILNMARVESIDLGSSRVIRVEGQAAGVALIARRGWTSRLAAMSIVPASRGQGAGRAAMDLLLTEASVRRDRSMVLEVIETNLPAVRLYQACGFETERRLVSFAASFPGMNEPAELQEVDIREVARRVTMYGLESLPWQISGESLAQAASPSRAFRLDDAYIVISNPAADRVAIHSVLVDPGSRRRGQATCLIKAVVSRYPDKKWHIPALCPEEIGGLFTGIGFEREALSQLQMRAALFPQE